MADRYWVGGTGTWNSSNTANWSTSSGGTGGASVPSAIDNVFIDNNSGTGTITLIGTTLTCLDLKFISASGSYAGTFAGTALQVSSEIRHVSVPITTEIGTAGQATVEQRGVVQFVLQNTIPVAEQCCQYADVGHVAGREQQRAIATGKGGECFLQLLMGARVAAE